jgi:hypothetical protein
MNKLAPNQNSPTNDRENLLLTERHGASNLSRKCALCVPRTVRRGREHRCDDECIRAKRLNFEYLVTLLHNLVQPDCLLELFLPFRACLWRLGVNRVDTPKPASVQDGAREQVGRVGCTAKATEQAGPAPLGRVREVCQGQQIQGNRLVTEVILGARVGKGEV